VVIIVGVYVFTRSVESPRVAQASDETEILMAMATKDSDKDGLPDWEEALYATDPHIVDTFHIGMTDGEAVSRGLIVPKAISDIPVATSSPQGIGSIDPSLPQAPREGTLTAAFAQSFFTLYVAAKESKGGGDLSQDELSDISSKALSTLSSAVSIATDYKTMKDLAVIESSPEALRTFAIQAEAVLLQNTSEQAASSELTLLKNAIVKGDTAAYGYLNTRAKAYRSSAAGLAVLKVPKDIAPDALLLINTLMRMGGVTADFAIAETDPLTSILALKQYLQIVTDLGKAFIRIGQFYTATHLVFPSGTPGASFVNMIADIENAQTGTKKL
jgi:hypothetical protein